MMKFYTNFYFSLVLLLVCVFQASGVSYKCRFANGDASYEVSSNRIDVVDIFNPDSTSVICHLSYPEDFTVTNAAFGEDKTLLLQSSDGASASYNCEDPFSPQLLEYNESKAVTNKIKLCDIPLSFLPSHSTNYFYADGLSVGYISTTNFNSKTLLSDTNIVINSTFYTNHNPFYAPVDCVYDTNGFLVVACRLDGLKVFSLDQNCTNFGKQVTCLKTKGDARALAVKDGIIWVADGSNGIGAYKLDEVGLITHLRQYTLLKGSANDIACGASSLYAACEEAFLVEIPLNFSKRHIPNIINAPSKELSESSLLAINTNGIIAITDAKNGSVAIFNTTNSRSPQFLKTVDLTHGSIPQAIKWTEDGKSIDIFID